MANENVKESEKLTGLSKHFNSTTFNGRANVAKATYGVVGLFILYKFLSRKKPDNAEQADQTESPMITEHEEKTENHHGHGHGHEGHGHQ